MAAGRPAVLRIDILADADRAIRELDRTESRLSGWGGKIAAGAGAAIGVLAGVGFALGDAVKAAAQDADGLAMLVDQLGRVTGAVDVDALSRYVDKLELATGTADDQLRPALARLATATGDLGAAQGLLSLALDVSAATGKDLEAVSVALAKAADGNFAALTRLGVPLGDVDTATLDLAGVTRILSDLYGGAASTSAETYAGKLARLEVAFDQVKEKLGEQLLPYLDRFVAYVGSPDFDRDLERVSETVLTLAETMETLAGWIQNVVGWIATMRKAWDDFDRTVRRITSRPDWFPDWPWMDNRAASTSASPAARTARAAPAITVNVSGALDPDSVAAQLSAILSSHARRAATGAGW